jgi:hypothetical protein
VDTSMHHPSRFVLAACRRVNQSNTVIIALMAAMPSNKMTVKYHVIMSLNGIGNLTFRCSTHRCLLSSSQSCKRGVFGLLFFAIERFLLLRIILCENVV